MLNSIPTSITTTISTVTVSGTQGSQLAADDAYNGGQADGGPVDAGGTYLVGERGPELFKPKTNGDIIPNESLTSGTQNFYGATIYMSNENSSFMDSR